MERGGDLASWAKKKDASLVPEPEPLPVPLPKAKIAKLQTSRRGLSPVPLMSLPSRLRHGTVRTGQGHGKGLGLGVK